ncbi:Fatty acid amide hydrolase [Chlorella vulgaris]
MKFLVAHDPEHLRQQAAASTQRWKEGRPLSPLDGVPFAVKDGCDALPYPTTSGTAFMAEWRTPAHSLAGVQVLLDAGAVLIGKANLHEIGLGTTGLNIRTGTPRNPHSTAHHTGGSSSGSAALVAAGICPFAVGSDGGGSIRIPAALCGIVGLKPTHERVGTVVGTPPIDQTVAVLGPLAASVQDCALMYAGLANSGQRTGETPPPPVMLPAPEGADGATLLAGKTAGIDWKWFEDAEPAVLEACRAAVALLQERGLSLVPVHLPEKALLRAAHTCTIVSEMRNNMTAALQHGPTRRRFNCETRVSLAVGGSFEAAHYLQAQKIRTRAEAFYRRAFERCDFIITPTLPCTAPPIKPAALSCGETGKLAGSDLGTTTSLMWYMQAANMLGLPAISVPVGAVPSTHSHTPAAAGGDGPTPPLLLPVALQLMAPCWHEASLLRVGAVLEAAAAEAGKALPLPPVWFNVLKEAAVDGALE